MSTDITYTFPADYPHDELRGLISSPRLKPGDS